MIKYLKSHPWKIIEEGWNPNHHQSSESIFSIGNGRFGQRAMFEEKYSGKSLQGSYVAGVYYPDKTRVGWWKNGYPEYFAKVLNSTNWIGLSLKVNGEELDLAKCEVLAFTRELDMQSGLLTRHCELKLSNGAHMSLKSERFCSMADDETAALRYQVENLGSEKIRVELISYLDGDVANEDTNWEERFWNTESSDASGVVVTSTKKTQFHLATAMRNELSAGGQKVDWERNANAMSVEHEAHFEIEAQAIFQLEKYVGLVSSLNCPTDQCAKQAEQAAERAQSRGFEAMKKAQALAWEAIWENADIEIEGDVDAQQGIRFNIFHLLQTYTGEDERLNIGPKGFTGEKYGGSTYWDTEAYCLPFYMATRGQKIARQLLVYRYEHLHKAIENAEKLGFSGGAALYPMVTITGEECHNEWEITFEEIHRNAAIAFAIFNYVRYTGDKAYLGEYGFDVLLGIARFWAQRVNWSEAKGAYVMLGVTGPNEYENNVNNNWYTNYAASWCLRYAYEVGSYLQESEPSTFKDKVERYNLDWEVESADFLKKSEAIFLPQLENSPIRLQQDGFLDKVIAPATTLPENQRPINQHWSWDRILRSCYIKQADVLQGFYFFADHFSKEELEANFDFYEPITVHESSLSPCVHAVLAARLGRKDKAYEMYLRTSRLDLDDYNHEAHEGLHITSMAGTWMSVVEGFGGVEVKDGKLHINPTLPDQWDAFRFQVLYRGAQIKVRVSKDGVDLSHTSQQPVDIVIDGYALTLS